MRHYNGKAIIDQLGERLWDTSTGFRNKIIYWIAEIMEDMNSDIDVPFYKFKLKKLLPLQQEVINMNIDTPDQPTAALSSGGSLIEDSTYKAYVSFLVYDEDVKRYMESEISIASAELTATASNKTIDLSDLDTLDGSTSYVPNNIRRRIYLATKADGETSFGEPYWVGDIANNSTTTYQITEEPTSTRVPISYPQLLRFASNDPYFLASGRTLSREDMDDTRRFNPKYSESDTPYAFDYKSEDELALYPRLSSSATTDQRTINYWVYRRPHQVYYDVDCQIDLPIEGKKALIEGVIWKGYEYRDRDGKESKLNNYQQLKKEYQNKVRQTKNKPSIVRDVTGDSYGYVVN